MVYVFNVRQKFFRNFEVDSTESVWYRKPLCVAQGLFILKLTPQSQYGIH